MLAGPYWTCQFGTVTDPAYVRVSFCFPKQLLHLPIPHPSIDKRVIHVWRAWFRLGSFRQTLRARVPKPVIRPVEVEHAQTVRS
jgi:hypothetical protein